MQVFRTSDPYACTRCRQPYELAGETERNGDRLPWLVVPKDVDNADQAIAQVICQRCLGFTGPKERGFKAVLEALGHTVVSTSPRPVAPAGIAFDSSGQPASVPVSLPAQGSVPVSAGIAFPSPPTHANPSAPPPPPGAVVPSDASAAPPPPPAHAQRGTTTIAAITQMALEAEEEQGQQRRQRGPRQDRGSRSRRGDRVPLSRRQPKPLRTGIGDENQLKLAEAAQRIAEATKRECEEALAALREHGAFLKRTRKHAVIDELVELSRRVRRLKKVGEKKRSTEFLLGLAGIDPAWLIERFRSYVVREILKSLSSELVWNFDLNPRFTTALAAVGMDNWAMRAAALDWVTDKLRAQLVKIPELVIDSDPDPRVLDFIGWATYASLLDDQGRHRDEIIDELVVEYYQTMTVTPIDPDDSGGGGTRLEARSTEPEKGECRIRKIEVDDRTVDVVVFTSTNLPRPNQPIPRVPTGTEGEAAPALNQITYPEGQEYGRDATLVLDTDQHAFTANMRDEDGKITSVPVMGAGQRAQMWRLHGSWPVDRSMWALKPLLDTESVLDVDLVLLGDDYEDWDDERQRQLMQAAFCVLTDAVEAPEDGHVSDLLMALTVALDENENETGPEIELRTEDGENEQPVMVPGSETGTRTHAE